MTSRRPAHSLPGSFVKEKRSPFKPKLSSALDGLETISSGDDASFTKGHDDEPAPPSPAASRPTIDGSSAADDDLDVCSDFGSELDESFAQKGMRTSANDSDSLDGSISQGVTSPLSARRA